MKTILLTLLLSTSVFFSQELIAITGKDDAKIQFKSIENLDTQKDLFNVNTNVSTDFTFQNKNLDSPTANLMASIAMEPKTKTIYFMPMASSFIYSLNTRKEINQIDGNKDFKTVSCDASTYFTRMTSTPEGNVYALNNNATELIKISQQTTQNLGALRPSGSEDIAMNQKAWGGDMISDEKGNLYVISAFSHVFKIDTQTLVAHYLGDIKGLPEGYTTNGAAVLKNGKVALANSKGMGMYQIDMETLTASKYKDISTPIYDLASPYFLNSKPINSNSSLQYVIYPTHVSQQQITLANFDINANLLFEIYDWNARQVFSQKTDLKAKESQSFQLPNLVAGYYIVKVKNNKGEEVLSQKIIVE